MVESLRGKKMIHVAVGALHCLAVTDQGQVMILHVLLGGWFMIKRKTLRKYFTNLLCQSNNQFEPINKMTFNH